MPKTADFWMLFTGLSNIRMLSFGAFVFIWKQVFGIGISFFGFREVVERQQPASEQYAPQQMVSPGMSSGFCL